MDCKEVLIKNNSFLKKIHRRTKSNYDNVLENNLSKSDKFEPENQSPTPQKNLQKAISSNVEEFGKVIKDHSIQSAQPPNKEEQGLKDKEANKEVFIEKLDLTPEEMIINQRKSDIKNSSDGFEFGKKKNLDLFIIRGLETSKSSNFEDRLSQIRQKYEITEENDNFFVIHEQTNEIDENLKRESLKDKLQIEVIRKGTINPEEPASKISENGLVNNDKKVQIHQKTASLVFPFPRQISSKVFSWNQNNEILSPNSKTPHPLNLFKIIQNLEKRIFVLETQVISLKNENNRLLEMNRSLEKTFASINGEKSTAILKTVNIEKRMQELERILKKTEENFSLIQRSIKTYFLEENMAGSLSAEKKGVVDFIPLDRNPKFLEDSHKAIISKIGTIPLRKSLDANLNKANSPNLIEKNKGRHEFETNLTDYIAAKGGKVFHALAQKKIFLTPKGGVLFLKGEISKFEKKESKIDRGFGFK